MSKSNARSLPAHPNLEHLKKEAKQHLTELRRQQPRAQLAAAQLAVARAYGFSSWRALKAHVESLALPESDIIAFLKAVSDANLAHVRAALQHQPRLANAPGPHPIWGGRPQPLHVAIERGHQEMFDLLLHAGANPSGDNSAYDGWSPLMLAAHWQRTSMITTLRQHGAKIGLIEALMLRDDNLVRILVKRSPASVHTALPNQATPLHFARTPAAAELLLAAGVPRDAKDKSGKTALETAAARGDAALARWLLQHGATAPGGIYASLGDLPRLQDSHRIDPDVIHRPFPGALGATTPLHAAVAAGHLDIVRWLLNQRVDIHQRLTHGATPLHTAAWHGQLAIARLLIDRGADHRATDDEHHTTPAIWARTAQKLFTRLGCAETATYLESLPTHDSATNK